MAEMGRLAVWVAVLAGGGAVVARRRWLLTVAVGSAAFATLVLARALVGNDYSLVYVADFSRRGASAPYRLAALWGGMAGSLLWFATLAGAAGWWAAGRTRSSSARGVVAAVTGGLVAALAGLVLAFADPFRRLEVPAIDGGGLTPILEHPAMLYHPPLLYLGLATLTGPFALSVAGLLGRVDTDADAAWPAQVRRWLVVPWTLLAAGMLAGAHWAYVELGWGGYWAWDPVENTALLPWLAVTLALHAGLGPRKPGIGQGALVCVAFLLALTGTMLTRSGAVSSVHAFAESRAIGRALGALVGVTTIGVAVLVERALRSARRSGVLGPATRQGLRGRLLAGHFAVVGTTLGVATIGTLAPLVTDLRGGDGIAIEGRYFASFAGPLAATGLVLVALVPVALRLATAPAGAVAAGVGAVLGLAVLQLAGGDVDWRVAVLGGSAGAALASAAGGAIRAGRNGRRVATHLAHAGIGLLLLGVAGTASGSTVMLPVAPGERVEVLGETVDYRGVEVVEDVANGGGRVEGASAVVADVHAAGRDLRPELVAYPAIARVIAETSLVSTPVRDVQVALRDAADDDRAVLQIGVHPLQQLVWWGGIVLVLSGLVLALESRAQSDDGSGLAPLSRSGSSSSESEPLPALVHSTSRPEAGSA